MLRTELIFGVVLVVGLLYAACQATSHESLSGSAAAAVGLAAAPGECDAVVIGAAQWGRSTPQEGEPQKEVAENAPVSSTAAKGNDVKATGDGGDGDREEHDAGDDDGFAANAFPPAISDMDYHKSGWFRNDCLRCHETGVGDAPEVVHEGMPAILLTAKCRSCHVLIPGKPPMIRKRTAEEELFAINAFPPMIPASASHREAWLDDNCLLCHESGVKGAPKVKHVGMPTILLKSKCRSCHVQVRSSTVAGR